MRTEMDAANKTFDIKRSPDESSVLSPLLIAYTVIYIGMMLGDFAARKCDMPSGMMAVYIALLGAYAADKEILRWIGKASSVGQVNEEIVNIFANKGVGHS